MTDEPYRDAPSEDGISPKPIAADEGNIPGTPSSAGVGLVVVMILVGLGLLYMSSVKGPTPTAETVPTSAAPKAASD